LLKSQGGGVTRDGTGVVLMLRLSNNSEIRFAVRCVDVPDLVLNLETLAAAAHKQRTGTLKGTDVRQVDGVKPRQITDLRAAIAYGGSPVLSLELDRQLRLDLAVDNPTNEKLVDLLSALKKSAGKPHSRPN
jgi:hypothetical protein